jgi:hypothetical protein
VTLAWPPRAVERTEPDEPAAAVWHHPVHADHRSVQGWLCRHFTPGPVHLRLVGEYYQYQAERRRGDSLTVRYTLEIAQAAFDHEPVEDIIRQLDEQHVADLLRQDPLLRLRYLRGGAIEPQRERPQSAASR